MQSKRLTLWILFALVAGVVSGYVIHHSASGWAHAFAGYISLLTDIFLRLIKMIIAPLVFSTLVVGIARMGDSSTIGRVGVGSRTIGYLKTSVRCCMAERYFEKFWQHGKPVPRSCHADQSS